MPFLAQYSFQPADGQRDALADAVDGLLGSLALNGQVWGEAVAGWVDGCRRVFCVVPRADALDERHASSRARDELASVAARCQALPTWRIVDDSPHAQPARSWRDEGALYLFTHLLDRTSPLCAGSDGKPLPVYEVPISDDVRERLDRWMTTYRCHDRLQLDSGPLALEAYRQLATPTSDLARQGRTLAAEVERATGRPTYYYLLRYWGRPEGEGTRPCPGCGGAWANPDVRADADGHAGWPFRCEPCRLVSDIGPALDEDGHADIGDWHA